MKAYLEIELPKSCYYCPFADGSWGYSPPHKKRCVVTGHDMPVDDRGVQHNQECPLVPVPEHGRLGDLDDFAKRMKNLVEKAENDGFDLGAAWYSAFVRHIELTPTIILADKEG